jgi:hypothetical protein
MSDRQHILDEAREARAQAVALLEALMQARDCCTPAQNARPDLFQRVTGASSIDQAIATTRRTIQTYDRLLGEEPGADPATPLLQVRVPQTPATARWTVAAMYESRTA